MRNFFFMLTFLIMDQAFCSVDTLRVPSKITGVTVFFNGAQLTRQAEFKALKGKHVVLLEKQPREITPQSIQVEGIDGCNILSVKFRMSPPGEVRKSAAESAIRYRIDTLEMRNQVIGNKLHVYDLEEKLLMDNSILHKKEDGSAVAEIRAAADFYRSRLNEIMQGKLTLRTESELNNKKIGELEIKINELTADQHKSYGEIQVTLDCGREIASNLQVSYYIAGAGWTPTYDFRVTEITKPLVIVYNANVFQKTGEDWKNVNVRLSTNNPMLSGEKPDLPVWYLGRVIPRSYEPSKGSAGIIKGRVQDATTSEPLAFANVVVMRGTEQITGVTTDFDGNYQIKSLVPGFYNLKVTYVAYKPTLLRGVGVISDRITFLNFKLEPSTTNLQEVQVANYKVPLISKEQTTSGGTVTSDEITKVEVQSSEAFVVETNNLISNSLKTNVANLEYQIDVPYSIPSDGSDYSIRIKEVSVPVNYVYQAIPKIDNSVFLLAEILQWNQLNLLTGKAGIYYQGTYTGESFIDAGEAADTLRLSLGRDRSILVKREGNKEVNDKRVIGSNVKETVGWDITVKNNKESKIRITVMDQFPLSEKRSIEVERLQSSGARIDDATGKLTWEFELAPNEKRVVNFRYSVKYPKGTVEN